MRRILVPPTTLTCDDFSIRYFQNWMSTRYRAQQVMREWSECSQRPLVTPAGEVLSGCPAVLAAIYLGIAYIEVDVT